MPLSAKNFKFALLAGVAAGALAGACGLGGEDVDTGRNAANSDPTPQPPPPSPVPLPPPGDQFFDFEAIFKQLSDEKPAAMARQLALLNERYDLSDRPSAVYVMSRGKPVQEGVRVKLPAGVTWESLAAMPPEQVRAQGLFPKGFLPLPHPKHAEGGMVFPHFHVEEVLRQTGRDLERFDLEFDLPDHFLPEFPPPIFLTTRPDLGDVSRGQLVTFDNFFELFKGILNPKQLDGMRLLVTPFPQQQFNFTDDRRSERPSLGVACLDCHVNGHTNAATHLVGDIRPQALRRRVDTTTLRGVSIQERFGSQRSLSSVEDFTEFEQRAAYFDGDPVAAQKKGVNFLDRGSEVQNMSEMQKLFDFPPAPKLDPVTGRLDPAKATGDELLGEQLFFGKARCGECHSGPHFSDNSMHDLEVNRFYEPQDVNGRFATDEGLTKTFPLRGIKDSAPYFHDGRLLTVEDVVEFFNLVLETRLNAREKQALHAFLMAL